jgi:hypothetical protein
MADSAWGWMDGWKAFVSDVTNKMKELLLFCTLYVTWLPGGTSIHFFGPQIGSTWKMRG